MTARFLWRWLVLWLVLGTVMRLLFLYLYPQQSTPLQGAGLLMGLFTGLLNDLLAFVFAPGVVALIALLYAKLIRPAFVLVMAVTVLVFIAEIFFWVEFEGRIDRLLFHYLAYPREVAVFLEEQFFLSLFFIPFVLVVLLLCYLVGWPSAEVAGQNRGRCALVLLVAVAGLMWMMPILPQGLETSRVAREFAHNGYLSVLQAARYDVEQIPWLAQAPGRVESKAAGGVAPGELARDIRRQLADKRHLVLIVEESLAGPVWLDKRLRQTYLPNLDRLQANSVFFSNVYATGSRTTRGLEAILNGFPPLPGISTTQRQGVRRLPSLARALSANGFHPVFVYGGWPGFSDFSAYWHHTGFQQIRSRDDFDEAFETSWGVSDGALFARVEKEMNTLTRQHARVFLSTLTVSHHRPYDFPPGAVPWPSTERKSAHAMAYADHSLGNFLERVQQYPWYQDTVFVVVADHGPTPRGDALIPADSFRIPLLVFAQGLQPQQLDGLGSSMSLPRTVLDMLSLSSDETFYGSSLLCNCTTQVPLEYGYHIGLLEPGQLWVWTKYGKIRRYAHLGPGRFKLVGDAGESEGARTRLLALFGSAYRWYYPSSTVVHN